MDQQSPADLIEPTETPRDAVEIRQDNAITISQALLMAAEMPYPLGKSTLQRWAKVWAQQASASPVKAVLVTNRNGNTYRLDRDDFAAWLFEQTENLKSQQASRGPMMPSEVPTDFERPHKTQRDPERPRDTSRDFGSDTNQNGELATRVKNLEDENLQLKIDLGVRRELISQVRGEMDRLRSTTDHLLRENGALQYQILQLGGPSALRQIPSPEEPPTSVPQQEKGSVDNPV